MIPTKWYRIVNGALGITENLTVNEKIKILLCCHLLIYERQKHAKITNGLVDMLHYKVDGYTFNR